MFDEPIRSERQPLVASLASGLKRFYARSIWPAAKDFENIKCVMNSPVREFLEANTPEAGRRVNLERRGQQGEQEIDALPGDPQSSLGFPRTVMRDCASSILDREARR